MCFHRPHGRPALWHTIDIFIIVMSTVANPFLAQSSGDYYAHWLFQWAFASTAATIVSGAVAERIRLQAYCIFAAAMCLTIYPMVVHWVWGGDGFLSSGRAQPLLGCGVLDFAGAGVVHVLGGTCALVAICFLGPRDGTRFVRKPESRSVVRIAPAGQSDAFKTLGTLALWYFFFLSLLFSYLCA